MKILSGSPKETLGLAKKIAGKLAKGDIICLSGNLGSGKTVFAKGIAAGLGINPREVTSPTFILLRQHSGRRNTVVYHFDLYRLDSRADIAALGYEEFFYGSGITLVEWAERLKTLMPQEYLRVKFTVKGKNRRLIELSSKGSRYRKLMEAIRENIRH
jgi:tRNA threonylcarbamoyladenosine biosynthesis protein TsaE